MVLDSSLAERTWNWKQKMLLPQVLEEIAGETEETAETSGDADMSEAAVVEAQPERDGEDDGERPTRAGPRPQHHDHAR